MEFKINPKEPIYTQVILYLKKRIATGELRGGDRILSVRECASELKVNPNTVQRAYTQLEDDGLIYTQRGIGKFIIDDINVLKDLKIEMLNEVLNKFLTECKELEIKRDDLLELISKKY